jgi:hypothetical protein
VRRGWIGVGATNQDANGRLEEVMASRLRFDSDEDVAEGEEVGMEVEGPSRQREKRRRWWRRSSAATASAPTTTLTPTPTLVPAV